MRQFKIPNHVCRLRLAAGCLFLLTPFAFAGCGGDSTEAVTAKVTGKVTFNGEPVTQGEVTMISTNGDIATEVLDQTGSFTIDQVVVGSYKVTVTPPAITEAPDSDPENMAAPKQLNNIPAAYQIEATSDLTAEVKEGDNSFTFDMKTDGGLSDTQGEGAESAP